MEYTADQQQYQQQQQQEQQHQYQQPPAYGYGPPQYDQSAAYYAYPNQQQHQYPYYPPQDSYSQPYPQFYQEAAPIHPPGVPIHPSAHHNQPIVYYPQQPPVEPQHQPSIPVSGSYSAVPSTNFVGNLDMVQSGNPPPQMHTAHRVGRRGGRPFRGGSRVHVGNHGLRPDGSALPHNRGRGQGGSRKGVTSAIPNSIVDPSGAADVMPPSSSVPGQATSPAQVPAAPLCPPPRMAWCELCKVDCNTPGILEQHKNGKRHKKKLKLLEQLNLNTVITGQQIVQVPNSGSEVHMEKLEVSEEKQHQQESSASLVTSVDNKTETELQKDIVNKSEASTSDPADANRKLKDPSEDRSGSLKRKRAVRGGKNRKINEGPRRPAEPPILCELCNIKCESQVVFNSHLAGKKHVANLKKFNGNQALYGGVGLQAFYPPNINAASPSFVPHIQQGLTDPQVVLAQLLTYVLSQAQVPGLAAPQVSLPATTLAPDQTPLSSSGNQYHHQFIQGSLATLEMGREVVAKEEADIQQNSSVEKSEASPFEGDNKAEIQTSESEKNEVSREQSFTAKLEVPPTAETDVKVENGTLDTRDKPLLSSTSEKDTRTECKIVSLDSGSNVNKDVQEEDPEGEAEDDPEKQKE